MWLDPSFWLLKPHLAMEPLFAMDPLFVRIAPKLCLFVIIIKSFCHFSYDPYLMPTGQLITIFSLWLIHPKNFSPWLIHPKFFPLAHLSIFSLWLIYPILFPFGSFIKFYSLIPIYSKISRDSLNLWSKLVLNYAFSVDNIGRMAIPIGFMPKLKSLGVVIHPNLTYSKILPLRFVSCIC